MLHCALATSSLVLFIHMFSLCMVPQLLSLHLTAIATPFKRIDGSATTGDGKFTFWPFRCFRCFRCFSVSFLHIGKKGNSIIIQKPVDAQCENYEVCVCVFLLDCFGHCFQRKMAKGKYEKRCTLYIYYIYYIACLLNFHTFCMRSVYCVAQQNSRNWEYHFSCIFFFSVGGSFGRNE